MNGLTQKQFVTLTPPAGQDNLADWDRLRQALEQVLQAAVKIPYGVARRDYPVIRASDYQVTSTLCWVGDQWQLWKVEPGDRHLSHYGLAADLGSTTITVALYDCNTGTQLEAQTGSNRQIAYGEDILTRIFYTKDAEDKRQELQRVTVESLNDLIDSVCCEAGVEPGQISALTVAANTTMLHFLLGIDAFCVFSAPFAPIFNRSEPIPAQELGLHLDGMVYCYPSVANYLGGDTISGILATDMVRQEQLSLLIDIGTNGEIALGNREFLIAGAGAAGPALEGGISADGMRAEPGAVDTVVIQNGALQVTTIAGEKPRGICGSGIVDLLAQMLLNGWMACNGQLVPGKSDRIVQVEGQWAVAYATAQESEKGKPLYFTQEDIRQFTDTKAAANTMVACLLEAAGVSAQEVDQIFLAGAFGQHLNLESAIAIGMYPDLPRQKFIIAGNTSLQGAQKLLLDRENWALAAQVARTVYYLEFAMQEDFLSRMQAAQFYPHTDLNQYPSVKARLDALQGK